jgi:hypothetical protein
MSTTDYVTFYDQMVSLIIDGRGYDTRGVSSDVNISLVMTATPTGETDTMLNLKDIRVLNRDPLGRNRDTYAIGSINKDYIIAILLAELGGNDILH